jgi:hypothetical protein
MGLGLLAFALAQVRRLALGVLEPRLGPQLALGLYLLMHLGYLVASALVAASGLVNAVVPYLTFTPPVTYLRFVQMRAERGAVDHG